MYWVLCCVVVVIIKVLKLFYYCIVGYERDIKKLYLFGYIGFYDFKVSFVEFVFVIVGGIFIWAKVIVFGIIVVLED